MGIQKAGRRSAEDKNWFLSFQRAEATTITVKHCKMLITLKMPFATRRLLCSTQRGYATSLPKRFPESRPFQPPAPSERISRPPKVVFKPSSTPQKRDVLHQQGREPKQQFEQVKDVSRAEAAARRVVSEGYLDPRYRPVARRVIALIVSLPIVIVFGWELLQRWAEAISEQRAQRDAGKVMQMKESESSHS